VRGRRWRGRGGGEARGDGLREKEIDVDDLNNIFH
jgi:hypothetical protein